jgi:hypothetical protein
MCAYLIHREAVVVSQDRERGDTGKSLAKHGGDILGHSNIELLRLPDTGEQGGDYVTYLQTLWGGSSPVRKSTSGFSCLRVAISNCMTVMGVSQL